MSQEPAAAPEHKRPGRRPGANRTRQLVLDAARRRFAEDGYAAATIRAIAADAGVDSSLVMQYFGSKEGLFGAVMSITPHALSSFTAAFDGPADGVGERVARAFLEIWDGDPADSEPMLAMLRGAASNSQASVLLAGFLQGRITEVRPTWGHDPREAALRVGLASSMLVGVILGRRIVRIPTLADESAETLVAVLAPALQAVLVGPDD